MNLFRTKSIEQLQATAASSGMVKSLGAIDLILLGIGCVIGTYSTGTGTRSYGRGYQNDYESKWNRSERCSKIDHGVEG